MCHTLSPLSTVLPILLAVIAIPLAGSNPIAIETKSNLNLPLPPDFGILLSPRGPVCGQDGDAPFFLVQVHTRPGHSRQREVIRETWGSVDQIEGHPVKVIFVMGKPGSPEPKSSKMTSPNALGTDDTRGYRAIIHHQGEQPKVTSKVDEVLTLTQRVEAEQATFGDLLMGNFTDSSNNTTMRHHLALTWAEEAFQSQACRGQRSNFVLKTEDEVFVELFHLFQFIKAVYGERPSRSLMCDVVPSQMTGLATNEGRLPAYKMAFMASAEVELAGDQSAGDRNGGKNGGMVMSSGSSGSLDSHPDYCNGMAYFYTPDLVPEFLHGFREIPRLGNGDMYVSGILRKSLGIMPKYLNLRYTYERQALGKWLDPKSPSLPLPYLFASLSPFPDASEQESVARRLWQKTVKIHRKSE